MGFKENNPGCNCCDSSTPIEQCTDCITTPASIAVTLTGFANGLCSSCTYLNNTFILDTYASACSWLYSEIIDLGFCGQLEIQVTFGGIGGAMVCQVRIGDTVVHYTTGVLSKPIDCTATQLMYVTRITGPFCTNLASTTCTIN